MAEKRSVRGFLLPGTSRDEKDICENKGNEEGYCAKSILDILEVTKKLDLMYTSLY